MFKCGLCGCHSKKGEKAERVILEKRKKTYNNGGVGWEIVKEVLAHTKCSKK